MNKINNVDLIMLLKWAVLNKDSLAPYERSQIANILEDYAEGLKTTESQPTCKQP